MRLINVNTLKLEEFHHDIPPYAILSHTWGSDEVTFEMYQEHLDVTNRCRCPGTNARNNNIGMKAGFAKIRDACRRARHDNLGYLWCDTNCIDKSSSAELTEAINSMYTWYRDSVVCYAYLADVRIIDTVGRGAEEFKKSRWLTRGWTLQELLAPKKVLFFNVNWVFIADREQLAEMIRAVTRIHVGALRDRSKIPEYSIAQRMSWAAGRHTSRQEDIAYCLLGIFDINMPLLYGEGMKAFTRLQEEIIKVSDDQSLLAWDFLRGPQLPATGVLALTPNEFASCGSIIPGGTDVVRRPFSITNRGVSLQVPMIRTYERGIVMVELNCSTELRECRPPRTCWRFPIWIWLQKIDFNTYIRSPLPMSRTALTISYPRGVESGPKNIYCLTTASRAAPWVSRVYRALHSDGIIPTGFHFTISFGRIRPTIKTFEKVFLPGDFSVHQVPPRGSPALSHEIVSAGNYAVLLSIAWDSQQHPKDWCHAIFPSMNEDIIRIMSADNWAILFESHRDSNVDRDDGAGRIKYIHGRIRRLLFHSTVEIEDAMMLPFVRMDSGLWEDHHGRKKVVVHLTFQEETEPQRTS